MKDLFKHASSSWVKYDRYEWKKDKNNKFYITPAPNAMPKIYDPLKEYQQMVLDALNVGLMIRTSSKRNIREAIMDFVTRYGLLGLMLGAALWGAGVAPLLSAAAKLCRKSSPAQAGKVQAHDEFNTDEERRAEEEKAP